MFSSFANEIQFSGKSRCPVRTSDVLRYLRSLLRDETTFRQAKMIVMGADGSGKTALIRRLTGNFNFAMKAETTVGTVDWELEPVETNNREERVSCCTVVVNTNRDCLIVHTSNP
jgi:GTPase SAR1 family protein